MGNSASHANGGTGTPSGGPGQPHHAQGHGHGHGSHHHQSQSQPPPAARRPSPQTRPSTSVDRGGIGTGAAGRGDKDSISGRPLKNKKKSLELPDLNLNSLSTISPAGAAPQRVPSQLPSAPIPIPGTGAGAGGGPAGRGRSGGSRERDGRRESRDARDTKDAKNTANTAKATTSANNTTANTNNTAAAVANADRMISEDALAAGPSSLVVPPPPPLAPTKISSNASFGRKEKKVPKRQKAGYPERTVKSMLYSGVPTNHDGIVNVIAASTAQKCQVQLLYPGQADSVSVSGTYEASWDIRTDLQYDEAKRMWSTTVEVSPAAYHIKFLVDGVWKTSDALPLATDSGGRLVNYIDVRTKGPEIKEWGRDWWGVGTEEEEEQEQGAWTTVPPQYLEQAARLEEQEEAYRRQSPGNHPRRRVLPMPPQLPRHLDKVILNTRAGTGSSGRETRSSINGQASPGEVPRGRTSHPSHHNHSPGARPSPMTGLSPAPGPGNSENVTTPTGGPGSGDGRRSKRDSRDSGSSGAGGGTGTRGRRGSSSVDIGLYGGALVAEGGNMSGTTVAIGSPIGDDNSVLPLPSHSVVNHLATSAIRNGILAVATTTRYKAKYISTVYYRPTHPEDSPDESEGAETDEPISPTPSGLPSASASVSGIAATLATNGQTNGAIH